MVVVLLVIFHDLLLPCDQRSNSVHQVLPIHQHLGSEALVDPGLLERERRKDKSASCEAKTKMETGGSGRVEIARAATPREARRSAAHLS